jgi:multiple sugar transport system substrate-binding protein
LDPVPLVPALGLLPIRTLEEFLNSASGIEREINSSGRVVVGSSFWARFYFSDSIIAMNRESPSRIRTRMRAGVYVLMCAAALGAIVAPRWSGSTSPVPAGRSEVVFWHFWGGADRSVVEDIVRRFNESQSEYWVRAVAVPGNNLDAKLFLSVAGGQPPDLLNQDDPVLADWIDRGVLQPVESFAGPAGVAALESFCLPAARRLSQVDGQWVAVPNGLDVRALYYNASLLDQYGLAPPTTLSEFDQVIRAISPPGDPRPPMLAFLPDPRRIWAWGYVFGGTFYDAATERVLPEPGPVVGALDWMAEFSRAYGADLVTRFRHGEQTLPGKAFPLLPEERTAIAGRYAFVLDGQWRVRDVEAFFDAQIERGVLPIRFGVIPLPPPPGGRERSGWVNGNFFVVPRRAANPQGAWAFMRFWIGLDDAAAAARTCAEGGWIPVSSQVIESTQFQDYLRKHPLMNTFVELAGSDQLYPYPQTRGAMFFKRTMEAAAEEALTHPDRPAGEILARAAARIQAQLDRMRETRRSTDAP